MTRDELHLDEKDANRCGKVFIPFFLFVILSMYFAQYWEVISWDVQIAIIALLVLIATIIYRNDIREMLYK